MKWWSGLLLVLAMSCKGEQKDAPASAPASGAEDAAVKDANKTAPDAKKVDLSDKEIEIKFYFQPDSKGDKTENKSVELEGDKLEIDEANTEGVTNREKRKATPEEAAFLRNFALQQLRNGKESDLDYPRIEFEVEIGEEELEQRFAVGKVPAPVVEFQKRFFKSKPFE